MTGCSEVQHFAFRISPLPLTLPENYQETIQTYKRLNSKLFQEGFQWYQPDLWAPGRSKNCPSPQRLPLLRSGIGPGWIKGMDEKMGQLQNAAFKLVLEKKAKMCKTSIQCRWNSKSHLCLCNCLMHGFKQLATQVQWATHNKLASTTAC